MSIIHVLDPFVANQIAAGEVVERPSSVVKELIENSLDAMSTAITIEISDGGTTFIRVTDNGIGMDSADAETAFLRHATSKIHDSDDLNSINTLGFRGEALAAIAAVSKVSMWTKSVQSTFGTKIELEAGEILSAEPFGAPNGTSITVSELFFNTPARKKFLKKSFIEAGYVQEVVLRCILSRPDVSFRFISDKKQVFFSSGDGNLENAIYCVYGKDVRNNLKPIEGHFSNGAYRGFIGDVGLVRSNRKREHININKRSVNCPAISFAIEEAYNTLLMLHKFPFFVISIEMDFNAIDVNVHPSKLEVRIQNETEIAQSITSSCIKVLSKQENPFALFNKNSFEDAFVSGTNKNSNNDMSSVSYTGKAFFDRNKEIERIHSNQKESVSFIQSNTERVSFPHTKSYYPNASKTEPKQLTMDSLDLNDSSSLNIQPSVQSELLEKDRAKNIQYHYIGVFLNTYLLVEMQSSLFVIDQHAAHERLLFDRFTEQIRNNTIASQPLLVPVIENVSVEEMDCFLNSKDIIRAIGFDAEVFGPSSISLRAVPMVLGEARLSEFLHESLEYLIQHKVNTEQTDIIKLDIATKACKAAVKAGDSLSEAEIISLLNLIESYDGPLTCPHGRPIYYQITSYQMEKWFKRIV